jgi:hypothetical protein
MQPTYKSSSLGRWPVQWVSDVAVRQHKLDDKAQLAKVSAVTMLRLRRRYSYTLLVLRYGGMWPRLPRVAFGEAIASSCLFRNKLSCCPGCCHHPPLRTMPGEALRRDFVS